MPEPWRAGPRLLLEQFHNTCRRGRSVDEGATISVRSLSPFGERVGVRGLENYRETLTPHPTPLPAEVGFIRLRPLQMPNSGKPEFGGRGSRSNLPPVGHQAS